MGEAEDGDADIVPSGKTVLQPGVGQWPSASPDLFRLTEGDQRLAADLKGGCEHMVPFFAAGVEHGEVVLDEVDHRRDPGRWIWMVHHCWFPRLGEYPGDMVQDIKSGLPCRMSRFSGARDNVRG